MKTRSLVMAVMAAALSLSAGQFNDHDQQVTKDWYSQHKTHPPMGLRDQDRLKPDQESQMHEGGTIDRETRRQVHPAPPTLVHQLTVPPPDQHYVAVGGHIGLVDKNYNVKAVVHLHEN